MLAREHLDRAGFDLGRDDPQQSARDGVVLGAHACALSVANGQPIGVPTSALKLSTSMCALN